MANLPLEVLHRVIDFIPISNNEMKNVMLVNKNLYAYCSRKMSFKQELLINLEKISDKSIVNSMKNSLRRFKDVRIVLDDFNDSHLHRIQAILENLGIDALKFTIDGLGKSDVVLEQSALTKWLNAMPNLLVVNAVGIFNCIEAINDQNTKLKLNNLEAAMLCSYGLGMKLHHSSKSSLSFLQLNNKRALPNISEIFKVHSETLSTLMLFHPVYKDPIPFRVLKLLEFTHLYEEYENNETHNAFLSDIIEHQSGLRSLNLGEGDLCSHCYPVNRQILNLICEKQQQLKILEIGINSDVQSIDIFNLRKLKNLKSLLLQFHFRNGTSNREAYESLALANIPSLLKLHLVVDSEHVTAESLRALGQSLPNLQEFYDDSHLPDFVLVDEDNPLILNLNDYLDAFPNLTSLHLSKPSIKFVPGREYPKIRELIIYSEDILNVSEDFIKSMPNLEKLECEMFAEISTLKAILGSKINDVYITFYADYFNVDKLEKIKKLKDMINEKVTVGCVRLDADDETDDEDYEEND